MSIATNHPLEKYDMDFFQAQINTIREVEEKMNLGDVEQCLNPYNAEIFL